MIYWLTMLYKNVVVPVCVASAFELSRLLYFTFRLNLPQLARQPVAHVLDSAGCHSSDYALIQLTSTQPSSSRSDMTPKGVLSEGKVQPFRNTETELFCGIKRRIKWLNGGDPANNGGSYHGGAGHRRFYLSWGWKTAGKGTNTDVGLSEFMSGKEENRNRN